MHKLSGVVSGAQTGVDRAALDAARSTGIASGGWVPKGRFAEDGPVPAMYNVWEAATDSLKWRTEANVLEGCATLILVSGGLTPGTKFTRSVALKHGRPYLVQDLEAAGAVEAVQAWLEATKPRILNVAGSRESKRPGIHKKAFTLLETLFKA